MKLASLILSLLPIFSYAGNVRDLHLDEYTVASSYLMLGRTTILRFNERPLKIIVGSSKHFSFEYTGNDIAIQPLGHVSTNMFIYTNNRSYGIYLNVQKKRHDDLIKVFWKAEKKKKAQKVGFEKLTTINLADNLTVSFRKIPTKIGVKIVDIYLLARGIKVETYFSYRKLPLKNVRLITSKDNRHIRAFLDTKKKFFPYLFVKTKSKTFKISIERRKLLKTTQN